MRVQKTIVASESGWEWQIVGRGGKAGTNVQRGVPVGEHECSGCFASFFEEKVRVITNSTIVDPSVYNGKKKIDAGNLIFMSTCEVRQCLESIKYYNSEIWHLKTNL